MAAWVVRAARGGELYDAFRERSVVSVDWSEAGDAGASGDREALRTRLVAAYGAEGSTAAQGASVLWRFAQGIREGDCALTYDPQSRIYAAGRIAGPYRHDPERALQPEEGNPFPHLRAVHWEAEIARDALSPPTRNVLGAISTLFRVRGAAEAEIEALIDGRAPPSGEVAVEPAEALTSPRAWEDLAEEAAERIKDRVAALDPYEMEAFVAGLLRGLGYSAEVSPRGPDRGSDILATPDPLGMEDPRIHVEVKHRAGKAGPEMIRSFLGGRRAGDRGLFVSTGGFTREARYEADRAAIPVRLMTLDDLVRLLLAHYDALDDEMRAMVPLRRIHWPL